MKKIKGFVTPIRGDYYAFAPDKYISTNPPALLLIAEDGEQLPEVPEWIKCSDRLPDNDNEVLVLCMDGWISIAGMYGNQGWRDREGDPPGADQRNPVTHWQHLPKAPHQ